jgi:hypothetical protein
MSCPPARPPKGVLQPDDGCDGWEWYCPAERLRDGPGETGLPDERTAIRYLIAHLGGHPARDARRYLIPARARLTELARDGAAAGPVHGDLIVLWAEVTAGDLVLLGDSLILVERAEVIDKPWGDGGTFPAVDITHRLDNGHRVCSERHGDRLTAVRRIA